MEGRIMEIANPGSPSNYSPLHYSPLIFAQSWAFQTSTSPLHYSPFMFAQSLAKATTEFKRALHYFVLSSFCLL